MKLRAFKLPRFSRIAFGNARGFTLIELMVAVAIIGVLSSLSISSYQKSVRKTRQSEAKLALTSIYSLEKAFYSEYSAYNPAFDAIGYTPEGTRRFYRVIGCSNCDTGTPWTGSITGYSGSSSVQHYSELNNPYGSVYNPTSACSTAAMSASDLGNDPQAVTPFALGTLCATCTTDWWMINQTKRLQNCANGL